jgi:pantetheine-phosphate adenylyltransferase
MTLSAAHRIAVYTGVFDPVHLGHLDVIQRGSRLFDRLIVGVGLNPDKSPFFTLEERVEMLERVTEAFDNVEVRPFTILTVAFVR